MLSAEFLPPLFQILTGLSFALLLAVRFLAGAVLRHLWGKLVAFAVILVALGNFLMSQGTAGSLNRGADLIFFAGLSYFVAALLVVGGLMLAARSMAPSGSRV